MSCQFSTFAVPKGLARHLRLSANDVTEEAVPEGPEGAQRPKRRHDVKCWQRGPHQDEAFYGANIKRTT